MNETRSEFARFCVVGVVGFIVDSSATLLATKALQWGEVSGRICAFVIAATVTWTLNQRFTFRAKNDWKTWLPYVGLTAISALVNVGVYAAWIHHAGSTALQLLIGIGLGSVCAMGLNFTISKAVIFRKRAAPLHSSD